jgi:hypothetical protein
MFYHQQPQRQTTIWFGSGAIGSIAAIVALCAMEPVGLGFVGGFGLATVLVTPAHARCLWKGAYRNDIADGDDCLEAQRTRCVYHMLTPTSTQDA